MKTVLALIFFVVAMLWITDVIGPREPQVVNKPKAPDFSRPMLPEPVSNNPIDPEVVPATPASEVAPALVHVPRSNGGPRKPPPPMQVDHFPGGQNRGLESNQLPQGLPTAPDEEMPTSR